MRLATHGELPNSFLLKLDTVYMDYFALDSETLAISDIDRAIEEAQRESVRQPMVEVALVHQFDGPSLIESLHSEKGLGMIARPELRDELLVGISGLNALILERLKAHLPDKTFLTYTPASEQLTLRVKRIDNGLVIKTSSDWNTKRSPELPRAKKSRGAAIRTLYGLPERSPYIAYNIISMDPTDKKHQGMMVQRYIPMTTLHDRVKSDDMPDMPSFFRYLKERRAWACNFLSIMDYAWPMSR